LAFAVGETPAPERSGGERGGGKTPLLQKPYKTKDESMLKEDPNPVIGYVFSSSETSWKYSLLLYVIAKKYN